MSADLSDPEDPVVVNALTRKCEACKAKPDVYCHNVINRDRKLPGGRLVHFARIERWDVP